MYQYKVLPFGLTNEPATFQNRINDVLWEYLNEFVTAYIDDILIYSKDLTQHRKHIRIVLQRLREAGLQADINKCEFHTQETKFLGLIVGTKGVRMDPEKIIAIKEWQTPRSLKQVQAFLGLCNYYRQFIEGFSKLIKSLTKLTRKDQPFEWTNDCKEAFENLKNKVTTAPILRHFNPKATTYLETDASDHVSGGVLSQKDENGIVHPVAFFSKAMIPTECNYDIYDKELLAIIRCLE
jgi:RNase H-like domain found in reverse transcriptase/Reverse transcriptase (RNA-dependent DNA polymerase)